MNVVIAERKHYFGRAGFPLAVTRVRAGEGHGASHSHDLTEVEHSHDFCELVVVTHGRAFHVLEGTELPVAAGDVFLLQGFQRHYFHDRHDLELINVMYDPEKIGLPENDLRRMPGYCALFMLEPTYRLEHRFSSRLHLSPKALGGVERLVDRMEREASGAEPGFEVALRAGLMELIVYLSRAYVSAETVEAVSLLRIGDVIGALERDFAETWRLEDLQKIAHMSRSSLMRVFRRATGQTPIEYLLHLRAKRAMELLRKSDLSITEIAFEVGFGDSNYFSRQFRRIVGISPRKFRAGEG